MNIWILYYSILYNFICLIIFFFYYSIQFYFLKYFLIITDEFTNGIHPSVFYRGDEINLLYMQQSLTEYVRQ